MVEGAVFSDSSGTHLAHLIGPQHWGLASGTSDPIRATQRVPQLSLTPMPPLSSPPPGPWGPGPPGEEDVSLIFKVEAQGGRVVFLGVLLLVTVTAERARQCGQEGAGPPSTQLSPHIHWLTAAGGA